MQLFITIINMVLLRGECSLNKMPKGWEEEKMLMKLSYLEKKLKEGPRKSAFSGGKAPKEKNISYHFASNYVCFLMKICILFLG